MHIYGYVYVLVYSCACVRVHVCVHPCVFVLAYLLSIVLQYTKSALHYSENVSSYTNSYCCIKQENEHTF